MGRATGNTQRAASTGASRRGGAEPASMRDRVLAGVRRMGFAHAYEVGGCIRDELLGRDPKDIDIAVAGHSIDEVLARAAREGAAQELVVAGQRIGVRLRAPWTDAEGVELALARTEVSTGPSRHQFAIAAGPDVSIEQDLARRDFTCNAIARDLRTGELIDPYAGARDIADGVLRTVSDRSFPEDPLRVLRGLARCAKDGLRPDERTFAQMAEWAQDPKRYLRETMDEQFADYVAARERELAAGPDAGRDRAREAFDADPVIRALRDQGAYTHAEGLDERAMRAWSVGAVDDPAPANRRAFEALTGYRWYGEVPLSPERVHEEVRKLLSGAQAADALRIARDAGALAHMFPELAGAIGFEQLSKYHDMTVDEHTLLVLQRACELDAPHAVRMAAVLHDADKPDAAWGWVSDGQGGWRAAGADEFRAAPSREKMPGDEHLHFYARPAQVGADGAELVPAGEAHEVGGARKARSAMNRLAASAHDTDAVARLVAEHMYSDDADFLTLSGPAQARRARRFLQRVGPEHAGDLMLLRRCDRGGKRAELQAGWDAEISAFETAVAAQVQAGAAVTVNSLAADGRAFMAAGFKGEAIGEVRRRLLELVVEDPALNTAPALLARAEALRGDVQAHVDAIAAQRAAAKAAHARAASAASRRLTRP